MGAGFGWSSRFKLEALVEKLHQLAQCRPTKSKGALDNAGLAADVAGGVEGRRLCFSERAHHLKPLYCRVGRLQRTPPVTAALSGWGEVGMLRS